MFDDPGRRRFLRTAGGATTALVLGGCVGGGGSTTETETDGTMETSTGTETETNAEMETAEPTTFSVRIENVSATDVYAPDTATGGQVWITPGAYAVHAGDNPLFVEGASASVGLEALAEAGTPTGFEGEAGLIDELNGTDGVVSAGAYTPMDTVADPNDPKGEVPGAPPIAPGGVFEFEVAVAPGQRLSFASMFVPSNDLFLAPGASGLRPFDDSGTTMEGNVTDRVQLWDAGTEPNAEPPGTGPDQAPAQSAPDEGDAETGVVRPIEDVDDGHDYPAVTDLVRVDLTPK